MDKRYAEAYLAGRFEDFSDIEGPDLEPFAERARDGESLRDLAMEAAREFIIENDDDDELAWLEENEDAIAAGGGDGKRAWERYDQGRMEALAHQFEADLLDLAYDDDEEDDEDGNDTRAH